MDKEKVKGWKFKTLVTIAILVFVAAVIVSVMMSCSTLQSLMKNYPDDNIIEEAVEGMIDHKTGIDIDLTPWSPEDH